MRVKLRIPMFNRLASPPNGKELEKWFDSQDVCSILRISPRTLQTLRTNGRLSYSQIGGKIYYNKNDARIKEFMASVENMLNSIEQIANNYRPLLNGVRFMTDNEISKQLHISRRTL